MPRYTTSQFIDAIPGSGGIISTIAKRVGCDWITAKKYVTEYPTVKAAYDAENESILDMSESVLINNIKLSLKLQGETGAPVDSGDARWLLSRKAKDRGYIERSEITGADGGPVVVVNWDAPTDND